MIRVGTDIIEIHRMEQAIERDTFLQRVFTDYERNYAWGRNKQAAASFAGIFAAKEACVNALGTGFRHGRILKLLTMHGGPLFLLVQAILDNK